jgi:DNA polymerase (family 10)
MSTDGLTNDEIGDVLDRIADLLEIQEANPHRVRAYRKGAESVRSAEWRVADLADENEVSALQDLPGIGEGLAGVITEYVHTGRSSLLDRLQGEMAPEDLFSQVPGIGEELAQRIASHLNINTLEELEQVAHDGRLNQVDGFGPKRVQTVKVGLAGLLSGAAQLRMRRAASTQESKSDGGSQPGVATLLQVDAEYRRRAEAGALHKIAPRRFNPEGEAWLPVMHAEQKGWDFTALYSNTARAHELGTTHDWVVIYYDRHSYEGQATIVTETGGALAGRRVVRGREAECQRYYEKKR